MDFYRMLSAAYDEIFPYSPETASMIKSNTPNEGYILDVGSATGQYVRWHNRSGYKAFGLEYVPGLIHFGECTAAGDMTDLPFQPVFDTISCIGNTLAHCKSYTHAEGILRGFYDTLQSKGTVVIQILNYHKILMNKPSQLPEIRTKHYIFKRHYEYEKNHIIFKGILKDGKNTKTSAVNLYPLSPRELLDAAMSAGFNYVEFSGDFKGSGFEMEEDFMLVAVLKK